MTAAELLPLLNSFQRAVLKALDDAGEDGLTEEEIQDKLAMLPGTEKRALRELAGMLLVQTTGERRATRAGRQANVWRACKRI